MTCRMTMSKTKAALTIAAVLVAATGLLSADSQGSVEEFILVCDFSGSIFYIGEGFTPPEPVDELSGSTVYGIGMGDFDKDGDYDFVIGDRAGGELFYYEKIGVGNSFAEKVAIGAYNGFPLDFAVEDFNEDGNLDFIFTNYLGVAYLFLGCGNGAFDVVEIPVPEQCLTSDTGDFNNDGHKDFVLQRFAADTGTIYIFFGDGAGGFSMAETAAQVGSFSWGLAAGDYTGDKIDDLIIAAKGDTTRFYLYPGLGGGQFGNPALVYELEFSDYTPADNFDFDHDGKMDYIFVASQAQRAYVFYGDGFGGLIPSAANPIIIPADEPVYAISCPPCSPAKKVNNPPVAAAGADISLAAAADGFAIVSLDGSLSSDPDGDALSCRWTLGNEVKNGALADFRLAVGSHAATLAVSDGEFEATDEVLIVVRDVTPPSISVSVSPNQIWPANNKMVKVAASVNASDSVSAVSLTLKGVAASESVKPGDISISNGVIYVRASTNSPKVVRVYTITFTATDAAGNSAESSATVTVMTSKALIELIIKMFLRW